VTRLASRCAFERRPPQRRREQDEVHGRRHGLLRARAPHFTLSQLLLELVLGGLKLGLRLLKSSELAGQSTQEGNQLASIIASVRCISVSRIAVVPFADSGVAYLFRVVSHTSQCSTGDGRGWRRGLRPSPAVSSVARVIGLKTC
jgi:hypothetical protein